MTSLIMPQFLDFLNVTNPDLIHTQSFTSMVIQNLCSPQSTLPLKTSTQMLYSVHNFLFSLLSVPHSYRISSASSRTPVPLSQPLFSTHQVVNPLLLQLSFLFRLVVREPTHQKLSFNILNSLIIPAYFLSTQYNCETDFILGHQILLE